MMRSLFRLNQNKKLIEAAVDGDVKKIKKALRRGADINARDNGEWTKKVYLPSSQCFGLTALSDAAAGGKAQAVLFLIEKGASVAAKDDLGNNALYHAEQSGDAETIRIIKGKMQEVIDTSDVVKRGQSALARLKRNLNGI